MLDRGYLTRIRSAMIHLNTGHKSPRIPKGVAGERSMRRRVQFASGILVVLGLCSIAGAAEWVQTWGAAPLPPTPAMGPFPATPSFENVTIRQLVRVSSGGRGVSICSSNEYGTKPLVIGAARVALADAKGAIQPGSERKVSFDGKPSVTI